MKQAGRVRGGANRQEGEKPWRRSVVGPWKARRNRVLARRSWPPRSGSAGGAQSPREAPRELEHTERGGVRRSYSAGGVTPRAPASVFGPPPHANERPRGSTGPAGRSRAAYLHGPAAPRKGEEGGLNPYGPTFAGARR